MNRTKIREAAVINMIEVLDTDRVRDLAKTELWCIREGIDTEEHPEIWDVTLGAWTTSSIINWVMDARDDRHESAALLLCTMQELS